jgi:hypothetical protein
MNGTWNLYVVDDFSPDPGSLSSWSLNFELATDPSITYTWSPAAGLNTTMGSSVTASPTVTTIYTVTGTNAGGCSSTATSTVTVTGSCGGGVPLTTKVFIEGYCLNDGSGLMTTCLYNNYFATVDLGLPTLNEPIYWIPNDPGGSTNVPSLTDCDTVVISAMDENTFTVVQEQTGILQTNGLITVNFTSPVVLNGSYFIRVTHRNALETWSAAPVVFDGVTTYDFSSSLGQAYNLGGGLDPMHLQADGQWAIMSGDIADPLGTHDGNIDLLDFPYWDGDNAVFNIGYLYTDFNGDVNIDLLDFPFWEFNNSNFAYTQHP